MDRAHAAREIKIKQMGVASPLRWARTKTKLPDIR